LIAVRIAKSSFVEGLVRLKLSILWRFLWLPAVLVANGVAAQNMLQATPSSSQIDIDPEIMRNSPVLQRWLQKIPDVGAEIQNDPSFRTRWRFSYSQYPANKQVGGFDVGISDLLIDRTGLALNASWNNQTQFNSYGADFNYYLLPLGGYINLSPVVGYRHLESAAYSRDGLNLGIKLLLVPARGGGGDIALQQSWVGLGTSEEVGISTLTAGYALTKQLRISGEIQFQSARESKDSRVGIGLEWMP
jgi:hypothetical protein